MPPRDPARKVGRYTSPHLVDFRERIVVDGRPIAREAVVEWVERWTPTCERLGTTFFEATTALAFDHFAGEGVDVPLVVAEVEPHPTTGAFSGEIRLGFVVDRRGRLRAQRREVGP